MLTAALLLALAPQSLVASQGALGPGGVYEPASGGFDWERLTPGNTGLPGDFTQTLHIDGQGHAWVAGYTTFWEHGGMAHFDGDHWTPVSNVDYPVIGSPRFNDIVEGEDGVLWIASDQGLLRYDPEVGPDSLQRWDRNNSPLPGNQITDLALDPAGGIWIASGEPGFSWGGLARFEPVSGSWNVWTTQNGLPWGGQWPGWDTVSHVAVVPDPGGGFTVWFHGLVGMATWKAGSFNWFGSLTLGGPTKPWRLLSTDPVDADGNLWMESSSGIALQEPDGTLTVVGNPPGLSTEISCVAALSDGRAILGTYYSDIWIWDGSWSYHSNWAGPVVGGGSHTYVLKEEAGGALWAGGIGGAAKFEGGSWQRYRLTNTGMLGYFMDEIVFDGAGNVLMNGNAGPGIGGFSIYDGSDWFNVNDYTYGLGGAWGLPSDDVAALCPRTSGNVAVAPAGGQGVFDWDGASFTNLVPQGYSIVDLAEDGLGRLWAVRDYGYGVFLIEDGQSTQFFTGNSPLLGGDITDVIPDPSEPGTVWLISAFGVHRTDGVAWDVYPRELMGLTQNSTGYHFTCGDLAPDGTLWLGTGEGLYHFDPATGAYSVRKPANSTMPSDDVNEVAVAPDGSVWCATFDYVWPYPGGLTHFEGWSSETFTATDSPLPHNQTATLAVRAQAGSYELWVGSASEGVTVIRPRPEPVQRP